MSYIRLKQASHLLCLLLGLSEGRYAPVSVNTLASTEVQDNPLPASRKLHQATAPAAAALPVNTSRFYSSDLDEPAQRQALLDLYASTAGPDWTVPYVSATSSREGSLGAAPTSAALETDNATFLAEQLSNFEVGVTCCLTASPTMAATCRKPFQQSVARLDMGFFGLSGTVPPSLGSLGDLQVINWVNNTDLVGPLPDSLVHTKLYAIYAINTRLCYASPNCPHARRYFGYEVTTEGDSFTMAFHDPIDAVAWCMHVQQRLLKEEWPTRLGEHAAACIVTAGDLEDDPSNRQAIFNGLRVRMAVNTGVPSKIKMHHVTKQVEYEGCLLNDLDAIGSLPSGGQGHDAAPVDSHTQRLVSLQTVARAPISPQNSGSQDKQKEAERRRGLDDLNFMYRTSDQDTALPMLINMGSHRFKELGAVNFSLAEQACSLYTDVVRSTLFVNKGYECQEKEGVFMMAFETPVSALEWALTLQLALIKVTWPEDLLATDIGRLIKDPVTDSVLLAGVRAKCGIFHGRADYFGLAVNRAARFMSAAVGGQVLAERGLVEEVAAIWASSRLSKENLEYVSRAYAYV
ncbi:hypothetical protein WJX84_001650 [Apatococcus fuscideae]|uniref:Guanylate cyclase domain-containing protein n=1 Tax=Apatococcus fuscideae TaxID=2026836 RepID=A0AAW1T3X2_9CHLO